MDIRFYHLTQQNLLTALPALLKKAMETQKPIMLHTQSPQQTKQLSDHLWTYDPKNFIPHGCEGDKDHASKQPVWITNKPNNANNAAIIIQTAPMEIPEGEFDLCCMMFESENPDTLSAARAMWKDYMDQDNLSLTYWQQSPSGWQKKA